MPTSSDNWGMGAAVAIAGDVNGDGYNDVIAGAPNWKGSTDTIQGAVFAWYGAPDLGPGGNPKAPDWQVTGSDRSFGGSLSSAGDVNGDGFADVIVGTLHHLILSVDSPSGTGGKAYVYQGSASGLGSNPGWSMTDSLVGAEVSTRVTGGADLNGDGYSDIALASYIRQASDSSRTDYISVWLGSKDGLGEKGTPANADWRLTVKDTIIETWGYLTLAIVRDVNGDGKADLLYGDRNQHVVRLYQGSGLGAHDTHSWAVQGEKAGNEFGRAAAPAGDVDGDGYGDLLVGAPFNDAGGLDSGAAYVLRGSPQGPLPAPWKLPGQAPYDTFGMAVSPAGDINGDGYADVLVGAPGADAAGLANAGRVYLFLGSPTGPVSPPAWVQSGQNAGDQLGAGLAYAGDINGDGRPDVALGAPGYPAGQAYGKAYLYLNTGSALASQPQWTGLGQTAGDRFGAALAGGGSVNQDTLADLLVGAPGNNGAVYLYTGASGGLSNAATWSIPGDQPGSQLGAALSLAGDLNGDGFNDIAIGRPGFDEGGYSDIGELLVKYGGPNGPLGSWDLTYFTRAANQNMGTSVSLGGDYNGDGYADLLGGAPASPNQWGNTTGALKLIAGGPQVKPDGMTNRDFGAQVGESYSFVVAGAGDLDGDGYTDLLATSPGYNAPGQADVGRVYLYRAAGGMPGPVDLGTVPGNLRKAFPAGDLNGDGYADLALRPGSVSGSFDLLFGSPTGYSVPAAWHSAADAASQRGASIAPAGDIDSDGYADLLVGAPAGAGRLEVYRGQASGPQTNPTWSIAGASTGLGTAVAPAGDVNGDGYADFLAADLGNKVYLYQGSALGPVAAAWSVSGATVSPATLAAGDVNGDGYSDLVVVVNSKDIVLYYGSPSGPSQPRILQRDYGSSLSDLTVTSLAIADINGDGMGDVLVTGMIDQVFPLLPYQVVSSGLAYVIPGTPLGPDIPQSVKQVTWSYSYNPFDPFTLSPLPLQWAPAGDVNGDGSGDMVLAWQMKKLETGEITSCEKALFLGSASGLKDTAPFYSFGATCSGVDAYVPVGPGDSNGDGFADLVVVAYDSGLKLALGNQGARPALARAWSGDDSQLPLQPWDSTRSAQRFLVSLEGSAPSASGQVRLQVQACPAGAAFGAPSCVDRLSSWTTLANPASTRLEQSVSGLAQAGLVRWRARFVYRSPYFAASPWRRPTVQRLEADVRLGRLATDLRLSKAITPDTPLKIGDTLTYTLVYTAAFGPATGVVLTDVLPAGLQSIHISSSLPITLTRPATLTAGVPNVWALGNLNAGQSEHIIITARAAVERLYNRAVINSDSHEIDPANNKAEAQTVIAGVVYVDAQAQGDNNGHSWADAFKNLQDALAYASPGDQVWVAQGVYTPGPSLTSTFTLKPNVSLYGGFRGGGTDLSQRNWQTYPTILSGDIGVLGSPGDNVYHVVSAQAGVTSSTVVDGFVITQGGHKTGSGSNALGGGFYLVSASPTLRNLRLLGNQAMLGGGMHIAGGSPRLTDVVFSGNQADQGAGLYSAASGHPVLVNTTFSRNTGGMGGAVVQVASGALELANSVLGSWGYPASGFVTQTLAAPGALLTVTTSDIQVGQGVYPGTGNLNADPKWWNALGLDGQAGTLDDDLRLRWDSPVIDQGDDTRLLASDFITQTNPATGTVLALDLSSRTRRVGFTQAVPHLDLGAYEATPLDVLAEADRLLAIGTTFRTSEIQLIPANTPALALQNYANFKDGALFYKFCANYAGLDAYGRCPDLDINGQPRQNVRNQLLDAVAVYQVAIHWPTQTWTPARPSETAAWQKAGDPADGTLNVRKLGADGALATLREIANVHLIFGNEFLIDATDYRFSLSGVAYADQILQDEIDQLKQAQQQFSEALDLAVLSFNQLGLGQYFTQREFELFGNASGRLSLTLDEIAARYRMRNDITKKDPENALQVYKDAFTDQYLQLLAFAQTAASSSVTQTQVMTQSAYLKDGSWEMVNNLAALRTKAQQQLSKVDPFGFNPSFVPLQPYADLLYLTEGSGSEGLLGTSYILENDARTAQREYDSNGVAVQNELTSMTNELDAQLFELCGQNSDNYQTCTGGLMSQNKAALETAILRLLLAQQQAQDVVSSIEIEQARSAATIRIITKTGQEIAASQLAIGMLEAERSTLTRAYSSEIKNNLLLASSTKASLSTEVEVGVGGPLKLANSGTLFKVGVEASVELKNELNWGLIQLSSIATVNDPNAYKIAQENSFQSLKQAVSDADVEGAASAATVKNLFLQLAEAKIEEQIARSEVNQLIAEHNSLVQKEGRLTNDRSLSANRVLTANSHLLNPAYRILRDTLTLQASKSQGLAAQFAYLTAKAAEYDLLTTYPKLNDVYKARTWADLRLFLDNLKVWYQANNQPGQLNRYPYTLSLAKDIWGLTDESLAVESRSTGKSIAALRAKHFQENLTACRSGNTLQCTFSTSLEQQRPGKQFVFSPNIWNNRIAGLGKPLANNTGVSVVIVTRQLAGEITQPEVVLIHGSRAGGAEAYRNARGQAVYYDPGPAVPVGYSLPPELSPANTTIVLNPGLDTNRDGVYERAPVPNGGLINLSVASTSWVLRIPASAQGGLDYSKIEDIQILIDTTGRALPNLGRQAERDAALLQAGQELPVEAAAPLSPEAEQPLLAYTGIVPAKDTSKSALSFAPTIDPTQIGGQYYGGMIITAPVPMAGQLLDLSMVNIDGVLTGTLLLTRTAIVAGQVGLTGQASPDPRGGQDFILTSQPFTTSLSGRTITRTFTLEGRSSADGNLLEASYHGQVLGLLPEPVEEQGSFTASRPKLASTPRLELQAGVLSLPTNTTTPITVTLLGPSMRPVTDTAAANNTVITFTTDLGSLAPVTATLSGGQAHIVFAAGELAGLAQITAGTGRITDTLNLEIVPAEPVQPVVIDRRTAYLPVTLMTATPDLAVQSIDARPDGIKILVQNIGLRATTRSFWVEAYINPNPVPTGPNQPWRDLGSQGMVWQVTRLLQPGESVTLYQNDFYYRADMSQVTWPMPYDMRVYVQADSWDAVNDYGAIYEIHELRNEPYTNNIAFTRVLRETSQLLQGRWVGLLGNPLHLFH